MSNEDIERIKDKNTFPQQEKTHWNLYSLQKLNIKKFIRIIDKVLRNENRLIK
ncbi:MAG: hypothetical protein GY839_00800 [candidate division Zixibacteria bacterium]|nr:hypothetical protein [candidate division Zixibacteria bacterium]